MSDDKTLIPALPADDLPGDNSPVEDLRKEVEKAQRSPDRCGILAIKSGNNWVEDGINLLTQLD